MDVARDRTLMASIALIGLGSVWHWIGRADSTLNLHSFRQTQPLWTVREFGEGNWSLASPVPILGPPWQIPFEFPAFQAIAAGISTVGGLGTEDATRLAGLLFFAMSALLLAWLTRVWFGQVAAIVTTTLFVFSPFANQWATSPLIEFLPVALILSAAALQVHVWQSQRALNWALAGTSAAIALASAVKVTTVVAWLPLIAVLVALPVRSDWKRILRRWLALAGPLALITLTWTRFADSIKGVSPLTEAITSSALSTWNFGALSQRLVVDNYVTVFERFSTMGAPVLVWVAALVVGGVTYRWGVVYVALSAVPLIAVFTFFNLYVIHDYYLAAVAPSIAAVLGAAFGVVAAKIVDQRSKVGFVLVGTAALLALSFVSKDGLRLAEVWRTPPEEPVLASIIATNTEPSDVVAVAGCDWDPTVLYYAHRRGVAIPQWWTGPLPLEIAGVVDFFASCNDPYVPDSALKAEFISEDWILVPVDEGLWRVTSKEESQSS